MTAPPCICPKNDDGLRTATDPKCFDHAPWNRHPSDFVVWLPCVENEVDVDSWTNPYLTSYQTFRVNC